MTGVPVRVKLFGVPERVIGGGSATSTLGRPADVASSPAVDIDIILMAAEVLKIQLEAGTSWECHFRRKGFFEVSKRVVIVIAVGRGMQQLLAIVRHARSPCPIEMNMYPTLFE